MNSATAKEVRAEGDWDLRGPDFETELVSRLTPSIGDADRLIRRGSRKDDPWANGFPNFDMYRTFLAGDTHLRMAVHDWCVAFAVAFAEDGGTRAADKDDAGHFAGQDAFCWMLGQKWAWSPEDAGEAIGLTPKSYRRFRDRVLKRLSVSLHEYWLRMQFAMLQVKIDEKHAEAPLPPSRLLDGRGWEHPELGEGNFRAMPRGSGC